MWEEAEVPNENPRVQAGDHLTHSHSTTADQGHDYRTWATEVPY